MKYGRFSEDGLEYIITTPETPRPWINYLTNETYCAIVSQCGGGYSFYKDCRTHRITRWAPENYHFDRPGRFIYVREGRKAWSLTYQPLRVKPSFFEARHGLGTTTVKTVTNRLASEVTYFVPVSDPCEIWKVTLENQSSKERVLEVIPYVEFLIGDYHEELRYRNIMNLYNRVWFDASLKCVLAKKTAQWEGMNIQPFNSLILFASSLGVRKCCTQKDAFVGRYNSEENPDAVLKGPYPQFPLCSGEDAVGSFLHQVRLKPWQKKTFTIVLGQVEGTVSQVRPLVEKYRKTAAVDRELAAVKALWRKRACDHITVKTPDKDFDVLVNTWLKYQVLICNLWSRSPSYYHEGSGGRGYRDSCQDSEAIVSCDPALTRQKILKIASLIRRDGTSAPGWSDTAGPHKFRPNKDHQVWLTATVSAYIKETGDKDILNTYVPYLKDRWINGWEIDPNFHGPATTDGEGTLLEHLEKNLEFCFNDVGEKGFPRIGHADWNDAIDAAGIQHRGESVWLAQALVRSLRMLAELYEIAGEGAKKSHVLQMAQTMQDRINNLAWDGEWYVRGFDDNGQVYGSRKDKEGKIFLNSQAWALLAQIVPEARLPFLIKSVDKRLNGLHGLALFDPACSSWVKRLGRISMFSEGTKENAAVFCHAVTFMAVGYALYGYGNKAYEAFQKIMPNRQKDMDLYKTEPYVLAEYLVGPDNPYRYGEGAFTWITGSSGWSFLLATEWILGVRREFEGLRIDPCLPSHWKSCFIRRRFRRDVYEVEIENPDGVEKGVKRIEVDGKVVEGQIIVPFLDGKTHRVRVVMGERDGSKERREAQSQDYKTVKA